MFQDKIPYKPGDETEKQENQKESFDVNRMLPGFESIREASKAERCEVSIDTLKSGIRIPDAKTLESIKNFLSKNHIFDLSKFQFEDATYEGKTKYVLKLSEDKSLIEFYLDDGQKILKKFGEIKSGETYNNTVRFIGNKEIDIASVSDGLNLECTVEELKPGSGVIDPVRVKEVEKELQAIKDAEAIAQYEAELRKQEYTVKDGDTLINIVKNKYGLKFNQSALSAVEEIVKYNYSQKIDLSDDSNPQDGVRGDKLQIGQKIYLPENLDTIQAIKNQDKERRIAFNKANNIKMKKNFK